MTQIPNYKMWVEEVNAKGGIYVKEYGKKLPVELIIYDDKSDVGTMVKLVEKLILQDKVDLLLPPWGTAMHFAIAPVATKYGYPVIGPTEGLLTPMPLPGLAGETAGADTRLSLNRSSGVSPPCAVAGATGVSSASRPSTYRMDALL